MWTIWLRWGSFLLSMDVAGTLPAARTRWWSTKSTGFGEHPFSEHRGVTQSRLFTRNLSVHRLVLISWIVSAFHRTLGYREFCSYLDEPSEDSYSDAVERMKISTRQYAKRQISWIRNKLLPAISTANQDDEDIVPFYLLDTSGKVEFFFG